MARTPVKKKTAKAREQELLKLVFDLQNQQKAMEKRFSALREENKTMQEINRQQKIALSRTSPRSKQQIALSSSEDEESAAAAISNATPSPRRSPRRRKNKRAPPPARQKKKTPPKKQKRKYRRHAQRRSDSEDGEDLERRLSDGVARRQAKSEQLRFLRKTLGSVIKLNMDEQILNGYFRQGSRFNKEKFEDHVRPIITSIMQGSEVDTDGLSAHVIFKLAVDIAKKRQS